MTKTPASVSVTADLAVHLRQLFVRAYRRAYRVRYGTDTDWGANHMPHWDGGDTDGGTRQAIWPKAANLCLEHQLDPAILVRSAFMAAGDRLPRPNALVGSGALERYRRLAVDVDSKLRDALAQQKEQLALGVMLRLAAGSDDRPAYASALVDPLAELSGLFRYCAAEAADLPEVAARYVRAATSQYLCLRAYYDRAWGEDIPTKLRREADRSSRLVAARR